MGGARFPVATVLLAVAAFAVGLAIYEIRARGLAGSSGITVADYRAIARADGRPAPDFDLPDLDGAGSIALRDFAGEVVVLNFWASWCGPCRLEAPDLQRTWERYRERGMQFLGVNHRDDPAAARAFVREFGITYPSVFDPAGRLAFDYMILGVPTTFIIDPGGRIAYRFTGIVDEGILSAALDDVLEESPS